MSLRVAVVLVTSYIGISPRSANHAYELAESGLYDQVYFIGQKDSKTYQKVEEHPKIKIIGLPFAWMAIIQKLPNFLYFFLRIVIHFCILCWVMFFWIKKPELVLVQNPPSIPVLGFLRLFKAIRRKCLVIVDVHNYGYTLMYRTKSQKMLRFCKWFEQYYCRTAADHCLTVSEKMRTDIMQNWGVKKATVCYDKANSEVFKPFDLQKRHEFFSSCEEFVGKNDDVTLFTTATKKSDGSVTYTFNENRPILLLTSTTYTEDEKIEYLFSALIEYEKYAQTMENNSMVKPKHLMLVITGSGERKKIYQELIKENRYKWKYISVIMKWFKADDYPRMVACADVGICLHYSSSGFDLPMKVVDMFGTGLPAVAARYPTIDELVQEGRTGKLFDNEEQLFNILKAVGTDWNNFEKEWNPMKVNVLAFRQTTFGDEWRSKVLPLLRDHRGEGKDRETEIPFLKKEK